MSIITKDIIQKNAAPLSLFPHFNNEKKIIKENEIKIKKNYNKNGLTDYLNEIENSESYSKSNIIKIFQYSIIILKDDLERISQILNKLDRPSKKILPYLIRFNRDLWDLLLLDLDNKEEIKNILNCIEISSNFVYKIYNKK